VGDVRGAGYFRAIELVRDQATKQTFNDEDCDWLLRKTLSPRLYELGLYCRADDRADPVLVLSPPLIAGETELREIERIVRIALTEASDALAKR
jgi:adenosylmethionine-8-amino-7-oxononanoate aminotransferase